MVKYNWQTHMYEVVAQLSVGGPKVVECSFYRECDAITYLSVRYVKC